MTLGNRVHFYARPMDREALVRCFVEILECSGPMPLPARGKPDAILAFGFPGGGSISIDFTDEALDPSHARLGAWLELRTTNATALQQRILEAGFEQIQYEATNGFYFAAPGGQVFGVVPG